MRDSLPQEFKELFGKLDYVQKVNHAEWSASCPRCGGVVHKDGSLPDRFRMWTNANGKNKVMGWCRNCNYTWFPKSEPLSPQEFEKWRKEQIEVEQRRKRESEIAIKNLRSEKIWDNYYACMNEYSTEIVKSWGINEASIAYWKLGFIQDYVVYPEKYHSPAISIPIWGFDGQVKNVKVRTLNPRTNKDRYRSIYKLGEDNLFVALYDRKFDKCLLVEGEKKAMVCAGFKQDIQIVGIQSKTPSPRVLHELDGFKQIYVCLDPDANVEQENGIAPLRRVVDILGKDRVKVITLPNKVDDMLLKYNLSLEDSIRYARSYRS